MSTSNKILNYGLTILLLAMSVKYSLLFPISTTEPPSNASSLSQSTTMQPPPPEYEEGAIRNISGCLCQWKSDSDSCVSLEEAVFANLNRLERDQDIHYPFFTLQDLFYSAIFNGSGTRLRPDPLVITGRDRRLGEERCLSLERKYNAVKSSGGCQWDYSCTQKLDQFPSFSIRADLEVGGSECEAVKMSNTRFVKIPCSASNNTLPHWLACECEDIITSYKDRASS